MTNIVAAAGSATPRRARGRPAGRGRVPRHRRRHRPAPVPPGARAETEQRKHHGAPPRNTGAIILYDSSTLTFVTDVTKLRFMETSQLTRRLPPLNALRFFEAAGRLQSIRQAAAELYVTPGAVSRQIQSLEAWLGVSLFEHGARSVSLTTAGSRYLQEVTEHLGALAAATADVTGRDASGSALLPSGPTRCSRPAGWCPGSPSSGAASPGSTCSSSRRVRPLTSGTGTPTPIFPAGKDDLDTAIAGTAAKTLFVPGNNYNLDIVKNERVRIDARF